MRLILMNASSTSPSGAGYEKDKRGFTLTEIAIVLGITGLIIGGIWVAASSVYNNMRVAKASTELLTITQNIRSLYASSFTVDPNADMAGFAAQSGAAATYVQAGIFPTDVLANVTITVFAFTAASTSSGQALLGTGAQNPWNGYINVQHASSSGGTANDSFQISFDNVPQQACITMITALTGAERDSRMLGVSTSADTSSSSSGVGLGLVGATSSGTVPPPNTTGPLPIPASMAQNSYCTAANQALGFTFKLR
jgi:prepilin-type N-terminal cleavage/methylation domain-containing protein